MRFRNVVPLLQVAVHGTQGDHCVQRQSTATLSGHKSVLHSPISLSAASAQALPPNAAARTNVLLRDRWPPPQLRLQVPHCCHSPKAQSTGCPHGTVLQRLTSSKPPLHPKP
jgi:hypothetical protein